MNQNQNGQFNGQPGIPNSPNGQFNGQPGVPNSPNQNFMPGGTNQPKVNNASQFIKSGKQAQPKKAKKNVISRELITILGVLAIVAILYFTYNYQLNKSLETIEGVPVAKHKIAAGAMITEEDVKYISVPSSTIDEVKAVTSTQNIIGKYVNYDTIIPENSFFYKDSLSATDTAPNSIFKDLLEAEAAIMINVDLQTTYGNSIMKDDIVDIYVDAIRTDSKGKTEYITGPLITGAKVLAVLDSAGQNVFADHENKLYPSYFVFTLDSDIIKLIRKAQKLSTSQYSMTIYPVIDGKTYKSDGATQVNQSQIVDLINNATIDIKNNN